MKRRDFLQHVGVATAAFLVNDTHSLARNADTGKIDRRALIARHKITLTHPDLLTPLSVGNGQFAFTADITGLQTFPEYHAKGMFLQTMAQWAWHTTPDSHHYQLSDTFNLYDSHGGSVPYPTGGETGKGLGGDSPAAQWLNSNPHKFDLGRLSLLLPSFEGQPATIEHLTNIHQEFDLWQGLLSSHFSLADRPVAVRTVVHPSLDVIAVRIISPLIGEGQIGARLHFPYAPADWLHSGDWNQPDKHSTTMNVHQGEYHFSRLIDGTTRYNVRAAVSSKAKYNQIGPHEYTWTAPGQSSLTLVLAFSPEAEQAKLPSFDQVRQAASRHWAEFWTSGGVIDLSESRDSRWKELERRIVLSQYQTAINCAGSLPPQETGLVQNSWFGKFHLEMHWWHAAHFPQWGREDLLMRSLDYYRRLLPVARETARRIGCRGARWPKMVGPEGRESPNWISPFLTWQQPHPIHYAELMYQARPTRTTLNFFQDIVLESAEFMTSFAWWNKGRGCFELGPPIVAAHENNFPNRRSSKNPTFDLAYWSWALGIAQRWRERLGLAHSLEWEHVRRNLAPLTVRDGIYREIEQIDAGLNGHPTMLGALGVVPETALVDRAVMQKTLDYVLAHWPLDQTWGWDYPMMAMTAARLGRPDQAIEALLIKTPKNRYLANGHNFQQLPELPLYLPGNGGLLFATAMMAAGWSGGPQRPAPGFPTADQGWTVCWEGLRPAL